MARRIGIHTEAELEDSELIRRCIDGDERAWNALVDRYQRLVYSVALRCGLNSDDADDVFQIVFTTLFRRLSGLRDQARIGSWLITTTHRESWRFGKAGKSREELDEELVDTSAPPDDLVEQADRDERVRAALARLDERCRVLLTALFLEAEAPSYSDIAERVGMPVGSIGPTRTRCFKKLEGFLVDVGLA